MLKVYPMVVSPNISPQDSDHTEYITSVHQRTSPPSLPMDTLELAPGRGVGPFRLGDSLWTVLDMLRARKTEVPKIEVSWDPDNAPKSSVTVHAGPITLLFPSSRDQRLAHILVGGLDSAALTLTYEGTVLSSSSHPLTRAGVARALGPTYAADGAARLAYPGVSFKFASASASTASGGNKDAVVEVNVTPREEDELPSDALVQANLLPGKGAKLTLPMGDVEVTLNETSAQDLLLDLGPPLRKYWKEDDRMDRMWGKPNGESEKAFTPTACFWNYFQHGLDFLVVDGTVTKIIAHSNIPGTPQFQQYARCPWIVQTDSGTLDITATLTSFRTQMSSDAPPAALQDESTPTSAPTPPAAPTPEPEAPRSTGGGKKKKKGGGGGAGNKTLGTDTEESRPVTPNPAAAAAATDGKAADIPSDAMLLDRSVEGGLDGVLGMSRSQLVGFPGLVVEVDEATGAVVSVQVWRE